MAPAQSSVLVSASGLQAFIDATLGSGSQPGGQYPQEHWAEIEQAIREAWTWLEGSALLIKYPGFREPNVVRQLSRRAQQLAREPDDFETISKRRAELRNEETNALSGANTSMTPATPPRPRAADDFGTIRSAKAGLGLKSDLPAPKVV